MTTTQQASFEDREFDDDQIEAQVFDLVVEIEGTADAAKRNGSAKRKLREHLGLDSLESPVQYRVQGPKGRTALVKVEPRARPERKGSAAGMSKYVTLELGG